MFLFTNIPRHLSHVTSIKQECHAHQEHIAVYMVLYVSVRPCVCVCVRACLCLCLAMEKFKFTHILHQFPGGDKHLLIPYKCPSRV